MFVAEILMFIAEIPTWILISVDSINKFLRLIPLSIYTNIILSIYLSIYLSMCMYIYIYR